MADKEAHEGCDVSVMDICSPTPYSCVGGPFGSDLTSKHYTDEGVPVLRGSNLSGGGHWICEDEFAFVSEQKAGDLRRNLAFPGDIIFTQRGTLGQVARIPGQARFSKYVLSQSQMKLTVDPSRADADYVCHFFRSEVGQRQILRATVATGVPHINLGLLKSFRLHLPPLARQRQIAKALNAVDDLIERISTVRQRASEMRLAVMHRLLTAGFPQAGRAMKRLTEEWRLGRIAGVTLAPSDWRLVRLTDVARLESGHTPSRRHKHYWDGGVPWISLHDSKRLDVPRIDVTAQNISSEGLENSSARLLPAGTVVFSRTATVGKCTIMGREMATSQDFANYICGPDIHNRYLMQVFRHIQGEWQRLMAGSTHQTIYMPVFQELQVLLPPIAEQQRIADAVEVLDARIEAETRRCEAARSLKRALSASLLRP